MAKSSDAELLALGYHRTSILSADGFVYEHPNGSELALDTNGDVTMRRLGFIKIKAAQEEAEDALEDKWWAMQLAAEQERKRKGCGALVAVLFFVTCAVALIVLLGKLATSP